MIHLYHFVRVAPQQIANKIIYLQKFETAETFRARRTSSAAVCQTVISAQCCPAVCFLAVLHFVKCNAGVNFPSSYTISI